MGNTNTSKTGRLPNVQPNSFKPSFVVGIFLDGEEQGTIEAAQEEFLSKSGNVIYRAAIKRGLILPEDALERLSVTIDGNETRLSAKGVHLSDPVLDKTGKPKPGTGGEPMACWTTMAEAAEGVDYMVNTFFKQLKAKQGNPQGFSLRTSAIPKAVGRVGGPQVIGTVSGLLVSQ